MAELPEQLLGGDASQILENVKAKAEEVEGTMAALSNPAVTSMVQAFVGEGGNHAECGGDILEKILNFDLNELLEGLIKRVLKMAEGSIDGAESGEDMLKLLGSSVVDALKEKANEMVATLDCHLKSRRLLEGQNVNTAKTLFPDPGLKIGFTFPDAFKVSGTFSKIALAASANVLGFEITFPFSMTNKGKNYSPIFSWKIQTKVTAQINSQSAAPSISIKARSGKLLLLIALFANV